MHHISTNHRYALLLSAFKTPLCGAKWGPLRKVSCLTKLFTEVNSDILSAHIATESKNRAKGFCVNRSVACHNKALGPMFFFNICCQG